MLNFINAVKATFQKFPVLIAWVVNIGVVVAARYGFHPTVDQVLAAYGAFVTFLSLYLHLNVVPVGKLLDGSRR